MAMPSTALLALKAVGLPLAIFGLALAAAPTLLNDPGPAASSFEAIERRIWWGGLFGLGVLLLTHPQLKPWLFTFSTAVFWIIGGMLVARAIGLVLDGADSSKQWLWFVVELVIVVIAVIGMIKTKNQGA